MARYPVKWKDREFTVGELSIGLKEKFCAWLRNRLRAEAMVDMRGNTEVLNNYLDGLNRRVWWVSKGMTPAVLTAINAPDGGAMYARLLLDMSEKELSDAELTEFLDEKEADPASDYMVAVDSIHEAANPKANGPTSGSGRTET